MADEKTTIVEPLKLVHIVYVGFAAFMINTLTIVQAANTLENRLTRLETRQEMLMREIIGPRDYAALDEQEKEKAP